VPRTSQTGRPSWAPDSGPMPAASQPVPAPQYYQGSGSGWSGRPPGALPPQQFTGATPWNQGQQPPSPRKRNPWPIVAGAAALVIVFIIAAIGIWAATHNSDNSSVADHTSTTTRTTISSTTSTITTTPTSPANDAQARLLTMLPAGYPNGACAPTTPKPNTIWSKTLAMVECGQNTNQGGPTHSVFGLYANPDVLSKAFNDDIATMQKVPCPGQTQSPTPWHYSSNPTVDQGMIACGTYKGRPNVAWSSQPKLMLSDVIGDSITIEDLHTWWVNYGG
jgi:serine/threonine kinase PknH